MNRKLVRQRPEIRRGERIYAIGDIHGCYDLFAELIHRIRVDARQRPARKTRLIIIGDMIDRGPRSADVTRRLFKFNNITHNLVVLRGNHEQMMTQSLRGDLSSLEAWLRFGGRETLMSWGLSEAELIRPLPDILAASRGAVPAAVIHWLSHLPFFFRSGDFFFVHAGIKPGIELDMQDPQDLMWIGDEFLSFNQTHPAVIVHGHSICETGPELLRTRIGLDTGAYRTGRLSAVAFEGGRQWTLTVTSRAVQ